ANGKKHAPFGAEVNSMSPAREDGSREIMCEQWGAFLAQFTRENRGAHARLESLNRENEHHVETHQPFNSISVDMREGTGSVWITFWSNNSTHTARAIHGVTAIRMLSGAGRHGAALEVQSSDGSRTILALANPGAYALPASS